MLNAKKGFTLSELLVSLAVLGLIAAFAVPKVLTSVGDSSFLANAKECLSVITAAYDSVKADNVTAFDPIRVSLATNAVTASNAPYALISKINYAAIGTYTAGANASTIDTFVANAGATQAAATVSSVRLGTGAIITFNTGDTFVTAAAPFISRMVFNIDPDGVGVGKPFTAFLGSDGRLFVPNDPAVFPGQFANYNNAATNGGTEVAVAAPAGLSSATYVKLRNANMVTA